MLQPATLSDLCDVEALNKPSLEVVYDSVQADIIETKDLGCHAGAEQLAAAASASGKTELLAQFAEDYPKGLMISPKACVRPSDHLCRPANAPHSDGSLRLSLLCLRSNLYLSFLWRQTNGGLRSIRFRVIGDRQTVRGYSEAVHDLAEPETNDAVVVINLCVPTASGVPLDLLPKRSMECAS